MLNSSTGRRRLATFAAACLLSVALPAGAAFAQKQKNKDVAPPPAAEMSIDYVVSIPTVTGVDSSIDDATLTDILSGAFVENADALAGLDATSITVPEIAVTVKSTRADEVKETTITFSNLVLENVTDGVADSVSLGSIGMETGEGTVDFGAMSAANFDIGGVLGIYGLVDRGGQTALETIYTDFTAEGGSIDMTDGSCTIGGTYGAEFKARPLKMPFGEMIALAQELEDDPDTMDPALIGQVMRMYADILTAFETSEVTFDGFSCDITDEQGRPVNFAIASMTLGGMSPGTYPSIVLEGLNIAVEDDGAISLDNFTFKPMDLSGTIAVLEGAPELVDEAWLEANARGLIPAMEGFSLSGMSVDVPDPDNEEARVKADIGNFDLTLGSYVNGIPTLLDTSAANIQVALPENGGDEQMQQLIALGVTDIDAGFRLAANWDETNSTIVLEEASVTGANLATVKLAGTIANATADLFALDTDTALMAAMGVAIQSLKLDVTDAGLSDIVLAAAAAEQGGDPAALRPIFAGLAEGTIIGFMAGAADAAKLGAAVNSFVSGTAKSLNITIDAKSAPGLGLEDFMAAEEDPTTLLGKVNISATAK